MPAVVTKGIIIIVKSREKTSRNTAELTNYSSHGDIPIKGAQLGKCSQTPSRLNYLLKGMTEGLHVTFDRRIKCKSVAQNMRSAEENTQPVYGYLETELQAGRIVSQPIANKSIRRNPKSRTTRKVLALRVKALTTALIKGCAHSDMQQ